MQNTSRKAGLQPEGTQGSKRGLLNGVSVKYGHVWKDGTDGKTDTDTEDGGVHGG